MNWVHTVWVNSHSTSSHTQYFFKSSQCQLGWEQLFQSECFCFISITFSCPACLDVFPGCWIAAYTHSFMVPSRLLEQWRLGRAWVLNKGLRPDTCGLWTDSSFVAEANGVGVGGQGPGTLGEERQAEGAPWETAWPNNHNNTSTRPPVIQWSFAGRKRRNGTTARCQQESGNPMSEGELENYRTEENLKARVDRWWTEGWRKEERRWGETERKADSLNGLRAPKKPPFCLSQKGSRN